ncbi:amidohydrolase family protein [Microbacterium esteraromaticum]|uniref:metal-dependent hydrolase family protein n=1 Tax=Microbacterium esteraromaticum TaxID=57043 RepID=UPI002367E188|nr:amidohydrolase family protein [Microbacterium esteraromaticum]WDH79013.1 amidohydrolase family protein [Microbacterium esteraromaticum]
MVSSALIVRGVTVLDGKGGRSSSPRDVLIEEGRITAVRPRISPAEDVREIDGTGRFLLPGFIDAHVHLRLPGTPINPATSLHEPPTLRLYRATKNMRATLRAGVTYVRDLGGIDYGAKMAVDYGEILGPRIVPALQAIGPTGGHTDYRTLGGFAQDRDTPGLSISPLADGPTEAVLRTRELHRAGAGVIKVMGTGGVWSPRDSPEHDGFSPEELSAIVTEATNRGLPVAAHAQGINGIKNSIRAGVTSIEHGYSIDDEAIELMRSGGVWLVPTLLTGLTPPTGDGVPDYARAKKVKLQQALKQNISRAVDAGVKIAMGTDSGVVPHGNNLQELVHLVECGMTPMQAIMAGTSHAAELLGIDETVGSVEVGKDADLVIADVDPESDISALSDPRHIKVVLQRGRVVHTNS